MPEETPPNEAPPTNPPPTEDKLSADELTKLRKLLSNPAPSPPASSENAPAPAPSSPPAPGASVDVEGAVRKVLDERENKTKLDERLSNIEKGKRKPWYRPFGILG